MVSVRGTKAARRNRLSQSLSSTTGNVCAHVGRNQLLKVDGRFRSGRILSGTSPRRSPPSRTLGTLVVAICSDPRDDRPGPHAVGQGRRDCACACGRWLPARADGVARAGVAQASPSAPGTHRCDGLGGRLGSTNCGRLRFWTFSRAKMWGGIFLSWSAVVSRWIRFPDAAAAYPPGLHNLGNTCFMNSTLQVRDFGALWSLCNLMDLSYRRSPRCRPFSPTSRPEWPDIGFFNMLP